MFNLSVLDQKKSNEIKENIWEKKIIEHIFGKVNEGDEIKKPFDLFGKKLMRAKKTSIAGIYFFLSPEINLFFLRMFFYLPKLTGFFWKSATSKCVCWVMRCLNLMRMENREKNIVAIGELYNITFTE